MKNTGIDKPYELEHRVDIIQTQLELEIMEIMEI